MDKLTDEEAARLGRHLLSKLDGAPFHGQLLGVAFNLVMYLEDQGYITIKENKIHIKKN